MARYYAQICTLVFFAATVGGLLLGDAGSGGGNLGSITLHLTWVRDVLDAGLLAAFVLIGFVLAPVPAKWSMFGVGIVLLAMTVLGFAVGDDAGPTRTALSMHFPVTINVFDLITGSLAVLCALGTLTGDDLAPPSVIRR